MILKLEESSLTCYKYWKGCPLLNGPLLRERSTLDRLGYDRLPAEALCLSGVGSPYTPVGLNGRSSYRVGVHARTQKKNPCWCTPKGVRISRWRVVQYSSWQPGGLPLGPMAASWKVSLLPSFVEWLRVRHLKLVGFLQRRWTPWSLVTWRRWGHGVSERLLGVSVSNTMISCTARSNQGSPLVINNFASRHVSGAEEFAIALWATVAKVLK